MPRLYLVRGLPNSHKSWLATVIKESLPHTVHLESTQFFKKMGQFNRMLLGAAHDWCYGQSIKYLAEGKNVVVSNHFVTTREVERYITGVRKGISDIEEGFPRVVHCALLNNNPVDVPQTVIDRMQQRWEPFEGELIFNKKSMASIDD